MLTFLFLLIGIILIIGCRTVRPALEKYLLISGIMWLTAAISIFLYNSDHIDIDFLSDNILVTAILWSVATAILTLSLLYFRAFLFTSETVEGKFVEFREYTVRTATTCNPVFEYHYEGQTYEVQTPDDIKKHHRDEFIVGKSYTIHISPKDPETACYKKGFNGYMLIMAITCLIFYLIPITEWF